MDYTTRASSGLAITGGTALTATQMTWLVIVGVTLIAAGIAVMRLWPKKRV